MPALPVVFVYSKETIISLQSHFIFNYLLKKFKIV